MGRNGKQHIENIVRFINLFTYLLAYLLTTCMGMGMAIIPMGINSDRQIQC